MHGYSLNSVFTPTYWFSSLGIFAIRLLAALHPLLTHPTLGSFFCALSVEPDPLEQTAHHRLLLGVVESAHISVEVGHVKADQCRREVD